MIMKIVEILEITGKITVKTGLHIGGSKDDLEIGGLENSVIKTSDGKPYIPGSSLKGKMRSLLELCQPLGLNNSLTGIDENKLHTCSSNNCPVCRIFGISDAKATENTKIGAPRLIVRDALLNESGSDSEEYTEVKYENTISRITGTAKNPRQIERVIPETQFNFSLILKIYDKDVPNDNNSDLIPKDIDFANDLYKVYQDVINDPKYNDKKYWMLAYVIQALKLLEYDALGGCGSRGCGKVSIFDKDDNGNPTSKLTFKTVFPSPDSNSDTKPESTE